MKTPAELEREIKQALAVDDGTSNVKPPWEQTSHPLVLRRAWLVKALLEDPKVGGKVAISDMNSAGALSITIEHPASRHWERFGVSKYGFAPGEVRFGSRHSPSGPTGMDKFTRAMKAAIKKAKGLT